MAQVSARKRNGNGNGAKRNVGLETILVKIREARNFDFRNYKRETLLRRLKRRMAEVGVSHWSDYANLLEKDPVEVDRLIGSMLIKVTSFFRDDEVWRELSRRLLPRIIASKRPNEELRVWCAGCSTGEEAYSVAFALAELLGPSFNGYQVKVFGTDVDEASVAFARRGIYGPHAVESVPKPMLERYFVQSPEGWAVKKEIRRAVVFGVNNLVSDAPISRLDLIICRNVFIYLDSTLQKRVLTRFHYALRRDGVLILGKSELIPFAGKIFEPIDLQRRIYRKDTSRAPELRQPTTPLLDGVAAEIGTQEQNAVNHFYRDTLDSLVLPVIGTSLDGSITLWNSAAERFFGRPRSDTLGKKIAALSLAGFTGELLVEKTTAVREARSEREEVDVSVAHPVQGGRVDVRVEVSPLRAPNREVRGLVYVVTTPPA